ncbi:MAG: calcium-binding protein [Roseobacter sp.]
MIDFITIRVPETLVNTTTDYNQITPHTSVLNGGGWVTMWTDNGQSSLVDRRVVGQVFDENGEMVGGEIVFAGTEASVHYTSIPLSDGRWVALWRGYDSNTSSHTMLQRMFDEHGNAVSEIQDVNGYPSGPTQNVKATPLFDGGWIVVLDGGGSFLQRFSGSGERQGPQTPLTDVGSSSNAIDIAQLANGNIVVLSRAWGLDGSQSAVSVKLLTVDLQEITGDLQVNTTTEGYQEAAGVAALDDGGWVVIWKSNDTRYTTGVFQQRFAEDGTTVGDETLVNTTVFDTQTDPQITALSDGGWVVVWQSDTGTNNFSGIYLQRYSVDGEAVGTETRVHTSENLRHVNPSISLLEDGGLLVTWQNPFIENETQFDLRGAIYEITQTIVDFDAPPSNGDDFVIYGSDDDFIKVGIGIDTISGGSGTDTLMFNFALKTVIFDAGYHDVTITFADGIMVAHDVELFQFSDVTLSLSEIKALAEISIVGTENSETILGTEDNDLIYGLGGNNRMLGLAGDDVLLGGGDSDRLNGGEGNDVIDGGDGNDRVFAESGDDVLRGENGNDQLDGNAGDDTISGGGGNDVMRGADGNDVLHGGDGDDLGFGGNDNDVLRGGAGHDMLDGSGGNDIVNGGAGNDILVGGTGVDLLNGDDGEDVLRGGGGDDILNGGNDNDLMFGSTGEDTLFGGLGDDILEGNTQADDLFGGNGNDVLRGGDGLDFLDGGAGNDILVGGNGSDRLVGGSGQDILRGQANNDTFVFTTAEDSAFGSTDLIDGIDGVGSSGGDVIDLSAIDADFSSIGDQAFTFFGELTMAQGLAAGVGALWVEDVANQTRVYGLIDADNAIDLAIRINDGADISASDYSSGDFIL